MTEVVEIQRGRRNLPDEPVIAAFRKLRVGEYLRTPFNLNTRARIHAIAFRDRLVIETRRDTIGRDDMMFVERLPDAPLRYLEMPADIVWLDGFEVSENCREFHGITNRLDPIWRDAKLMDDQHTRTMVHRKRIGFSSSRQEPLYLYTVSDSGGAHRGRMPARQLSVYSWEGVQDIIGMSRLHWKTVLQDEMLIMEIGDALVVPDTTPVARFVTDIAWRFKLRIRQRRLTTDKRCYKRVVWLLDRYDAPAYGDAASTQE